MNGMRDFPCVTHFFELLLCNERMCRALYTMKLHLSFTVIVTACIPCGWSCHRMMVRRVYSYYDTPPSHTRCSIHEHHRHRRFHPTSPLLDYICTLLFVPVVYVIIVLRACCWCRPGLPPHIFPNTFISIPISSPTTSNNTTLLYRNVTSAKIQSTVAWTR